MNRMFVVLLRFSQHRSKAPEYMKGHNDWIKRGFDDGVFLMTGNLQPNRGGVVVAHGASLDELRARLDADPFVAQQVVEPEILEITPSRADPRLAFIGA
jgi:uncharacterized protein YciI